MNIQLIYIIALLLYGAICKVDAQNSAQVGEKFMVNGLKVVVRSISANDIISVQLFLHGGSLNLTEATQGIEPLCFESAMRGSSGYPKEKLNSILDKTGAELSTYSEKDFSCVSFRCLKPDFDKLWSIFADVILNPAFEPEDVEMVRKYLLLGIKQRRDSPPGYIGVLAEEGFYASHPYCIDPVGVERTVSAITIDQMKQYLRHNLVTSKLLLVVVGNVNKEQVLTKVESTLGRLPHGAYTDAYPPPVSHNSPSVRIVERELPTNYIRGTFAMPGPRDPGYHAALVMMNVLKTRVFNALMRDRSLTYGPSVVVAENFSNWGYFNFTTLYPDSAVQIVIDELRRLQNEPVSSKDLKDRIAIFLNEYNLKLETNQSIGQFLARHELAGSDWRESAHFIDQIRNVTADDIQRVAHKYFRNIQTVIIGNPRLVNKDAYIF